MTYQIWHGATTFTNPSILVTFDYSHQASEGYTFIMKEFDCIMSGQLDNPSSSVDSYLSDNIDRPDLQQTLIEESQKRCLNRIRLMQLKQAEQRYQHKTKKVSVTALLKQINYDHQASINDVIVIELVEPNHNSGMYQLCFYFYIYDLIILQ